MVRYCFKNIRIDYPDSKNIVYCLSVLHDFLSAKGFKFSFATLSGGCDDAYHTGEQGHGARYTDYNLFINNYDTDFLAQSAKEHERSGGWVSLNYDQIGMTLSNDNQKIKFLFVDIDDKPRMLIFFNKHLESNEEFKKSVKDKVFEILNTDIEFSEDTVILYPSFWYE